MIELLPLSVQTTYQELLEAKYELALRGVSGRPMRRTINGKEYWYEKVRVGEKSLSRFIGADTPELRARIEKARESHDDAKALEKRCSLWAAQLRAAGLPTLDVQTGKFVNAMAKSDVFRLGGVLVGTHAFRLYTAELGAWVTPKALAITEDIDIAAFENMAMALDEDAADPALADAFKPLGLEPAPALDAKAEGARWRMKGGGAVIDFLTPSFRDDEGVRPLERLGVTAQALHFLDYLITDPIPAVALYRSGVMVRIPRPERFAVHKLIVSTRRRKMATAKARKDIAQAKALIDFLAEERQGELVMATEDARSRGPKWNAALDQAIKGDEFLEARLG